jgi:thiol-disulfide isomerase/thioredoxin
MNNNSSEGPSCSIESKPTSNSSSIDLTKIYIDLPKAKLLTAADKLSIIFIGAPWCSTCAMQKPHLPKFIATMEEKKISVAFLEVEVAYDVFTTPAHKDFTMQLFSTPPGREILPAGQRYPDDSTSIIAIRGREFYPTLFAVKNNKVLYANKDVATQKGLDYAASEIFKSFASETF